jgi:hypothetical protein
MIEQGLVALVQGDARVFSVCSAGGFFAELPKGQALPSWTYTFVSDVPLYSLDGPNPLAMRRLQIDSFGTVAADSIRLAAAIDGVLSGYAGPLSDPDHTVVQGCFRSNLIDFFDNASRTYRRMLEYELWFYN